MFAKLGRMLREKDTRYAQECIMLLMWVPRARLHRSMGAVTMRLGLGRLLLFLSVEPCPTCYYFVPAL